MGLSLTNPMSAPAVGIIVPRPGYRGRFVIGAALAASSAPMI
jgi:hypothetical protein